MTDFIYRNICTSACVYVCVLWSHRRSLVCVGQDAVNLDLTLVQGALIDPQLFSSSVCRTKTLPRVILSGVLLREKRDKDVLKL